MHGLISNEYMKERNVEDPPTQAIFPRLLTFIVHRRFLSSMEILVSISQRRLDFINYLMKFKFTTKGNEIKTLLEI